MTRKAASRARQMLSMITSGPTDDSFEKIAAQANHIMQNIFILYHKWVRFTDRSDRGMTATPKNLELTDHKCLRMSPKFQKLRA